MSTVAPTTPVASTAPVKRGAPKRGSAKKGVATAKVVVNVKAPPVKTPESPVKPVAIKPRSGVSPGIKKEEVPEDWATAFNPVVVKPKTPVPKANSFKPKTFTPKPMVSPMLVSNTQKMKDLDHLGKDLKMDDIEDHVVWDPSPFNVTTCDKFVESVITRYENHQFDEDDKTSIKLLWNNDRIQNLHSKFLASEITRVQQEITAKQKSIAEKAAIVAENRKRKGDSTFDLPVKHVRTRSIISHDMSVLHLRFCSLCDKEMKTYDETVDHLYDPCHVNRLSECFSKGSVPRVDMKTIQCTVCNTKPYQAADLNSAFFDHISSYAHAVNGISPPKKLSKQLELTAKANLCAYYVNKEIPTNLAQQAAGHIIGQASSSIFMSTGKRQLTKADLKLHPLRITGNLADAEDNAYKSAAFSTFCMTNGMTADQVKKMWSWQPLFLPMMHIRGKCGLCKLTVENSLDSERAVSGLARSLHISGEEHKEYCRKEWKDIDKRLGLELPVDVKCFILSYCALCDESFAQWNSILSHVMGAKHSRKCQDLLKPWQPMDVIDLEGGEEPQVVELD